MKVNFVISGKLFDEQENGIKGSLSIFGYENYGYLNTEPDGSFILRINNFPLPDIFFKQRLMIAVKTEKNIFDNKLSHPFRVYLNKHIKLKIYPFSNRVIEQRKEQEMGSPMEIKINRENNSPNGSLL